MSELPLEERLQYKFSNFDLLQSALTHRSLNNGAHYERLEFLGDAVFDLAVAELLHTTHSEASEGQLTKIRAALVREASLAAMARELSLGGQIKMSKGEIEAELFTRQSVLADVMEAVVGAVFLDGGYLPAKELVVRLVKPRLVDVEIGDPKSELQEWLHSQNRVHPNYLTERVDGPEEAPVFETTVEIGGKPFGTGRGSTKKSSQQEAAREALGKLQQGINYAK